MRTLTGLVATGSLLSTVALLLVPGGVFFAMPTLGLVLLALFGVLSGLPDTTVGQHTPEAFVAWLPQARDVAVGRSRLRGLAAAVRTRPVGARLGGTDPRRAGRIPRRPRWSTRPRGAVVGGRARRAPPARSRGLQQAAPRAVDLRGLAPREPKGSLAGPSLLSMPAPRRLLDAVRNGSLFQRGGHGPSGAPISHWWPNGSTISSWPPRTLAVAGRPIGSFACSLVSTPSRPPSGSTDLHRF
jgi:hypothetical protein